MVVRKTIIYPLVTIIAILVFLAVLSATAFMTKELNSDYKLVSVWGGQGNEPGKFTYPAGLKIYDDEVYVVDVNSHKIQVFDLEGNYRREFGKEGEGYGEFNRPWNLYFHGGELYVAAYENNRIDVFDRCRRRVRGRSFVSRNRVEPTSCSTAASCSAARSDERAAACFSMVRCCWTADSRRTRART